MIGDATAHQPNDYGDKIEGEKMDWKEELKKLLESNIRCYGVYCKTGWGKPKGNDFFQSLSELRVAVSLNWRSLTVYLTS